MTHPMSSAFNRIVPCALVAMSAALMGFVLGLYLGYGMGTAEPEPTTPIVSTVETEPEKSECRCGSTRTCPFGPGIVGQQTCWTSPFMVNEWTRCEPVPEGSE